MNGVIRQLRSWGRGKYDSLFCKKWETIQSFGQECVWTIDTVGLNSDSIIYSAGVGKDISFEKELVSRFICKIELFDPSPTGIETMQHPENQVPNINYYRVGLAKEMGVSEFSIPSDPEEGSFTIKRSDGPSEEFQCYNLEHLMKERGQNHIDLLKMDIEGFEYGIIEEIVEKSIRINQICVEFHHFLSNISRKKTRKAISALRARGYALIFKNRQDYTFYMK